MPSQDFPIQNIRFSWPVRYGGNLFFLILFLIFWLRIGVILLLKKGYMAHKTAIFYLSYQGEWKWLFFWAVVFFPIAFLLLLFKGIDVIQEERTLDPFLKNTRERNFRS